MRTSDSVAKVYKRRGNTTQADRKTMGLRGDGSSAESQAGDNVRSLLIVDRGFAEGSEVVWIDGSDFELELESVKAQLARLWPRQTNWRKVWFSRQAWSWCVCILPALLQTPTGTFNNACTLDGRHRPPHWTACLRAVPSMHVLRGHPYEFSSHSCSSTARWRGRRADGETSFL